MFGNQIAGGEVPQEPYLGVVAESGAEQVDHFGDYQDGYEQRTRMGFEQLEALGVVVVVGVDVRVERACVDQEGYWETSSRRISSMRVETSDEPLLPAAAAINLRRPVRPPR